MEKNNLNIITAERIYLKNVSLESADDMYEYCSDESVVKFLTFDRHKNINDTINAIKEYFLKDPIGKYGIYLNSNNKLIGTIDIRLDSLDYNNFGWVINKKYQKNGYCSEALSAMLKSWWSKIKSLDLYAKHDIENKDSEHFMDNNNFIKLNKKTLNDEGITYCVHKLNIENIEAKIFKK
ncbi:ribosomal-protein-alanine N-acetyltransferase [Spiroplasma corruscae]|uniref:Ribosomal-protein-alanine N-acetyltransferase n=1 Tax=Spiroplasma corruscae TaxID=216934 RepID=A0A222EPM3_9MOLU|nr:GNAT family N-acetyltransferase [Spiroplasma corruscae]ASP28488.1 ribosomal-protein-alanine N-acetyltransferase [Spiroplasma corruscae]